MDVTEIFVCECHTPEHMLIVSVHDNGDDEPDLCLQITANHHLPWHQRIWPAVKYIFGQPNLRWHDIQLSRKDTGRFLECVDVYRKGQIW
ncbi:hypothetical protein UFOVP29_322 [uncultured Caudovirales phage]|uniref:Uncharacterized protein n=1 Tax=uncultured Caudovirales phage TaxID=2100421 RepID=A0A6J5KPL9_9CAUD|nr:hypothetical protein UFOVP29_322 [uncultured Caudovirales phage]